MKHLLASLLLLGAVNAYSQETSEWKSPSQIVTEACQSKMGFIQATADLEKMLPAIGHKEELFPFLEIVDDLEKCAKDLDFQTFGADPLERTKQILAGSALKWISVAEDDMETLKTFFRISNEDKIFNFIANHNVIMAQIRTNPELFMSSYKKLMDLTPYLDSLKPPAALVVAYRQLTQDSFWLLTQIRKVSLDEVQAIAVNAGTESEFNGLLNYIRDQLIRVESVEDMKKIVTIVNVIKSRINVAKMIITEDMRRRPGFVMVSVLDRILNAPAYIAPEWAGKIVQAFDQEQVEQVAALLNNVNTNSELMTHKADFVIALAEQCLQAATRFGNARTDMVKVIKDFLGRTALMKYVKVSEIEGVYSLNLNGKDYVMTATFASPSELAVNLTSNANEYTMMNAAYDIKNKQIVVSRFYYGYETSDANFTIYLRPVNGELVGSFNNGYHQYPVKAKRIATIKDYQSASAIDAPVKSVQGKYEGTLENGIAVQMVVTQLPNRQSATLVFPKIRHKIGLNMSWFNVKNNAINLTSPTTNYGSIYQVRGLFTKDGFVGDYIVGGKNLVLKLKMKKVSSSIDFE